MMPAKRGEVLMLDSMVFGNTHVGGSGGVVGILPGEGIGPEVVGAALGVLDALESVRQLKLRRLVGGPIGFDAHDNGGPDDGRMTEETAAFCQRVFDEGGALFCGPGGGRFVYDVRRRFDLYCKLAPIKPLGALNAAARVRPEVLEDVDIMIVRDNAAGVYQGKWSDGIDERQGRVCTHWFSYNERQVRRIAAVGARLAVARRGRMHVAIKDGGVPAISKLWRDVCEGVAAESKVECIFLNADHAAYRLIQHPREFDVLVAPNLFGDMLADLGAVLLGSRGMSYSVNFSDDGRAAYQTGHGAAADLAGTDRANPAAQILSLAMMLRHSYALDSEAQLIEQAVEDVFREGWRTDDLAEPECRRAGTRQIGELVAQAVVELADAGVSR
jgi:3-isopropylmalate dehydrogenase